LETVFDFIARYVRKIHGDRYLKGMIRNNPGVSLMDIITPSDIAYTICLIKNSKDVWCQYEDDEGRKDKKVKPVFTTGEGKKRTFGDTTWNKTGLAYFKRGQEAWKMAFQGQMQACNFRERFDDWVGMTGKTIRLNNKTRMSLYSVLGANREEDMTAAVARQRSNEDEEDEDPEEAEIIVDYNTDSSTEQAYGAGAEWSSKKPAASVQNTRVNETEEAIEEEEEEEEEDRDINLEESALLKSPPVVTRRGAAQDRNT
jgi:hypothetical protein